MQFLVGLIVGVAAIMFFLFIGKPHDQRGITPPLSFEQQVRLAQDVTATGEEEEAVTQVPTTPRRRKVSVEEDERISAEKNYQPADSWKWIEEAQRNVICEQLWDMPWVTSCHTPFERPPANWRGAPQPRREPRQRVVRHAPVIPARMPCRGGCPYYED